MRMRVTLKKMNHERGDINLGADLQQAIWKNAPTDYDREHPLYGIHRDEAGQVYFEFATESPEEVQKVIDQSPIKEQAELTESPSLPGNECMKCGNVAGPINPAVCTSCGFRDIAPCPVCGKEVPRESYLQIVGNLRRCPNCKSRVRFHHNTPIAFPNGDWNQPLIVIEEEMPAHEVR
jgi:hypothetical protein